MFGGDVALRFFRLAIRYVAKSGEVWCEGARIFLDPACSHFNPRHARIALNFAAFFTPQYGDIFIEVSERSEPHPQGIRLHMIVSDALLLCHDFHPLQLTPLLAAVPSLPLFIRNASLFNPNYGPLWDRCAASSICTPNEVALRLPSHGVGAAVCSERVRRERGDQRVPVCVCVQAPAPRGEDGRDRASQETVLRPQHGLRNVFLPGDEFSRGPGEAIEWVHTCGQLAVIVCMRGAVLPVWFHTLDNPLPP